MAWERVRPALAVPDVRQDALQQLRVPQVSQRLGRQVLEESMFPTEEKAS